LVGFDEVCRQRRVARHADKIEPASRQGLRRALAVVDRLGAGGVGQPGGQRLLAAVVEPGEIEVCRRAGSRGQGQPARVAGPPPPAAEDL